MTKLAPPRGETLVAVGVPVDRFAGERHGCGWL